MNQPQTNELEQEIIDFYWERGKYEGRNLGPEQYKIFIKSLLQKQREDIIEMVEKMKKNGGKAKFYGPSEAVWLKAKMIKESLRRKVWDSALSSLQDKLKERK